MRLQAIPAPVASRAEGRAPRVRTLVAVASFTALISVALVLAARSAGIATHRLLQDPAAQFGFPPYIGLISYAGVALLVATGAILVFAAAIGRRKGALLWVVATFSGLLAVDDLLMLHESVFPKVLGLPEWLLYAVYLILGGLVLAWLPRGRESLGLLVPLSLLAVSVAIDLVGDLLAVPFHRTILVEDTAKVAGLATWLAFWANFAAAHLREATPPALDGAGRGPGARAPSCPTP